MVKKSSALSLSARLTSVSTESISRSKLSKGRKAVLTRIAAQQATGDDSGVDYSDIPGFTDAQLAEFRRPRKAGAGLFHQDQWHSAVGDEPDLSDTVEPDTEPPPFSTILPPQVSPDNENEAQTATAVPQGPKCRSYEKTDLLLPWYQTLN